MRAAFTRIAVARPAMKKAAAIPSGPAMALRRGLLGLPLTLLLACSGTASASSPAADKLAELGRVARHTGSAAAEAVLNDAARYWFATDKGQGRSLAGSGPALAAAIRLARGEALRIGVKPVPMELKRAFRRHYPARVLDKARWMVAAPGSRLGLLLARWPVREGAVTLGEVIVFKTRRAAANRRLFAHELVHVEQYHRLGIDGFASRYAANRPRMEKEAQAKARRAVPG